MDANTTTVATLASFSVQDTLGVVSTCNVIATFLFGIGTLQTYNYFLRYPGDPFKLKALVIFIWVGELAHCICVTHILYYTTILCYGHLESAINLPITFPILGLLSTAILFSVQIFFAERLKLTSGSLILPLVICILAVGAATMILALSAIAFRNPNLIIFEHKAKWIITATMVIAAVLDVVIASALCYHLGRLKSRSLERTAIRIARMIRWTFETGVVSSLSHILLIIFFLKTPSDFVWLGIFICLTRISSNMLLASLNSREVARRKGNFNVMELGGRPPHITDFAQKDEEDGTVSISVHVTKITEITG